MAFPKKKCRYRLAKSRGTQEKKAKLWRDGSSDPLRCSLAPPPPPPPTPVVTSTALPPPHPPGLRQRIKCRHSSVTPGLACRRVAVCVCACVRACLHACVYVCVCMCVCVSESTVPELRRGIPVAVVVGGGGAAWCCVCVCVCVCVCFHIMPYVNCFGATVFYVRIEYCI